MLYNLVNTRSTAFCITKIIVDNMKVFLVIAFVSASLAPYVDLVDAAFAMSMAGGHGIIAASPSSGINCNCDSKLDLVCGTDNITYSNMCHLKCASNHNTGIGLPTIDVAGHGECNANSCVCPAVYKPVCGSDNQTYSNECAVGCENKRRIRHDLPPIYIVYEEACKQPICVCKSDVLPVCGTDSKTYKNLCLLVCVSHLNQAQGKPGIGLKFFGACPVENCMCPLIIDPVCGTNKRTYNNRYLLDCENRRRDQLAQSRIDILHDGPCIHCICSELYEPVCASNKKTYPNQCKLDCENKRRALYGLPPLTSTSGECSCSCSAK